MSDSILSTLRIRVYDLSLDLRFCPRTLDVGCSPTSVFSRRVRELVIFLPVDCLFGNLYIISQLQTYAFFGFVVVVVVVCLFYLLFFVFVFVK